MLYHDRASAYVAFGDASRVMADYDRAIELDPEDAAAHYKRGTALALSDRHDHAIESFDRAINLDPDRSQWYNTRGISKSRVNGPVAALDDYDSAIDLDPKNADAYYNRAIANARLGNVEDSNANLERAIALDDGYKDAYLERGNAYAEQGNYTQAVQDFERASECKPDDPTPWFNAGNAYKALEDDEAAIEAYHHALEEASAFPDDGRRVHESLASLFLDRDDLAGYERHQFQYAVLSVLQNDHWTGISVAVRLLEVIDAIPSSRRQRNAAAFTLTGVWLGDQAGGYAPPKVKQHETVAKQVLETSKPLSNENQVLYDLAMSDGPHNQQSMNRRVATDLDREGAIDNDDWETLYRLAVEALLTEARVYR